MPVNQPVVNFKIRANLRPFPDFFRRWHS